MSRWIPCLAAPCAALVAGAASSAAAPAVVINRGEGVTADPRIVLSLRPPPGAREVQIAFSSAFASPVTRPAATRVEVTIPSAGPEERAVTVWVRYRAGRAVLPGVHQATIALDTLPPRVRGVRLNQREPLMVCTPDGPPVGPVTAAAVPYALTVDVEEPRASTFQLVGAVAEIPGDNPVSRTVRVPLAEGQPLAVVARDRLGNTAAPYPVTVPAPQRTTLTPASLPFATALDCPTVTPTAWNRTITTAWARSGRIAANRTRVQVAPSRLTWTWYAGQGLALNWVHAATDLKLHLKGRRSGQYRSGVAEAVSLSTVAKSPSGRPFRLNENWFRTPDDGHPPPWRDAMGTAALLAALVPAVRDNAPTRERDAAIQVAQEYLETFSVDYRDGGVRWSDEGPGAWYLEYTYRSDERVLNGFMQSLVSLDRFARQADRRAWRDPRWADLGATARARVTDGAHALHHWLPRYDLGGGATRYSLTSGPATDHYRAYHQQLLGQLAQVGYLPRDWRLAFNRYRVRWGGASVSVP